MREMCRLFLEHGCCFVVKDLSECTRDLKRERCWSMRVKKLDRNYVVVTYFYFI